jgi:hypothetical protein
MSITRLTTVLAALVTALALAPSVPAQLFKPFAFPPPESDFQFFAPGDIDTYGGGPEHKTGWFATYDRVYMNVQRPDDAYSLSEKMGDFTWGNRFDLGFIDDNSKGWVATIWHVNGPNEEDVVITERINRFMTEDDAGTAIQPRRDDNNRLTGDRDYLVTNSINVADMTGFELNRTWLWKPLHSGGRLSPFVGFRYARFIDFYQRQTYARFDEDGVLMPPNGVPSVIAETATTEQLTSLDAGVINDMFGGQLGMHWEKDYRRWNFSGDVKGFALQNFQNWDSAVNTETSIYGGLDTDTAPTTVLITKRNITEDHAAEFVFGMEVRADAAYRITRDLSVRFGCEFIDFGQGIGRGIDLNDNDQAVIMYGVSMGVTYNR